MKRLYEIWYTVFIIILIVAVILNWETRFIILLAVDFLTGYINYLKEELKEELKERK